MCTCAIAGATCCGSDVCTLDACGVTGDVFTSCAHGCEAGTCVSCTPSCDDRDCGPDGCGGSCGACEESAHCDDGACTCAIAGATCCGSDVCTLDACGASGELVARCDHGCEDGACVACESACAARACGPDGCGGDCGTCAVGACDPATGRCETDLRLRLMRERRGPNAEWTALGPVEAVPVGDLEVAVRDAEGGFDRTLTTDAQGWIEAEIPDAVAGTLTLTFAASVAGPDGPSIGVVDAEDVPFPSGPGEVVTSPRVWAWSVTIAADARHGATVTVPLEDGAGALQLLAWTRDARAHIAGRYPDVTRPSLGVLWTHRQNPRCASCYFPADWGPLVVAGADADGAEVTFERFMWLSGADGTMHHFTPSMAIHEYGHYVMDVYSRAVGEGGPHTWGSLISAGLAWSEGFASFYAQAWASDVVGALWPRFFSMESGTQYWIDLEALGVGDDAEVTNVQSLNFPPPRSEWALNQPLNEAVVAAILWDLWDDAEHPAEADAVALGDHFWPAFAAPELVDPALDRGYHTPDLVDMLDAIRCRDLASFDALGAVLLGFPYDDDPRCAP